MKILKPVSLNLESIIQDDKIYCWHKNQQGKLSLTSEFVKGKNIKKHIPQLYYFISMILINQQNDYNKCPVSDYNDHVRVKYDTLAEVGINYKKLKQFVAFLINQKIITVVRDRQMTLVQYETYFVDIRYYKLLYPYNGKFEIFDIDIEFKKPRISKRLEKKLIEQPFLRHQYDSQQEFNYDLSSAEKCVNTMFYLDSITTPQFISYYNLLKRINNKRFYFIVSDKCDRVFTTINNIPKILRPYILDKSNHSLKELDYGNFNVMLLYKIFDEYINTHQIDEKVKVEFAKYISFMQDDFYKSIQDYFKNNSIIHLEIDRTDAKEIVLKYWINANQTCDAIEFQIMDNIFPELTKLLIKLKGGTYNTYKEFYNSIMRQESKLINEIIYDRIIKEFPDTIVYGIFDGLLVEEKYVNEVQKIMLEEGKIFIGHEMKVKIK